MPGNIKYPENHGERKFRSHEGIYSTNDQRDTTKINKMGKAMVAKWQLLSKRKYGVLEPKVK